LLVTVVRVSHQSARLDISSIAITLLEADSLPLPLKSFLVKGEKNPAIDNNRLSALFGITGN